MSERSIHFVGWTLFILSALFFIASSLRAGDMVGVFGGVLFLLGCLVFVVHMLRQSRASASRGRRDSGG